MKHFRAFGLCMAVTGLTATSAWMIGCSSDNNNNDGGTDGSVDSSTDSGGNDTGSKDTGMDQNNMDTGTDSGNDSGALDCNSYCTFNTSTCKMTNNQYLNQMTCMKMCAKFAVGDAGAMMGDSLNCREYHTTAASMGAPAAMTHCPHSGPYGFGQSGLAGGVAQCVTLCQALPAGNGSGAPGNAATGNTRACREYHLENAYSTGDMNGMGHCGHAVPLPNNTCM